MFAVDDLLISLFLDKLTARYRSCEKFVLSSRSSNYRYNEQTQIFIGTSQEYLKWLRRNPKRGNALMTGSINKKNYTSYFTFFCFYNT